ncbi:unnamed protein product, partial [marine sediment metagenome]
MAQTKTDCYSYVDDAELLQTIADAGYILNGGEPLTINNTLLDEDSGK